MGLQKVCITSSKTTILQCFDDDKLQLKLLSFWSLSHVWYSKKNITFP